MPGTVVPRPRQVVIVFLEGKIETIPSLRAAVLAFRSAGYLVTLVTEREKGFPEAPWSDPGIVEIRGRRPRFVEVVEKGWVRLRRLARWFDIAGIRRRAATACVIGVDAEGIWFARDVARCLGAPLVYWSLEILFRAECRSAFERDRKSRELRGVREAAFLIAQDPERASLLVEETERLCTDVLLVPNSPGGPAGVRRSMYLKEKYGLADSTRVVLCSGSVAAWACSDQLVASTHKWPEPWRLVVHTRANQEKSRYLAALRALAPQGKVIFSTEPLAFAAYERVVRSADVGVAFYCEKAGDIFTGSNIRSIGFSSGKALHYLHEGIPIIHNCNGLFDETVATFRAGVRVEDPGDTADALATIASDYDAFAARAARCSESRLGFDDGFRGILRWLQDRKPMDRSISSG